MARRPRIIIPGHLYHVTQRGTRKQTVFQDEEDFEVYLRLLRRNLERREVLLHQYCCMTNHVHLLVQPLDQTGLGRAIGTAHSAYTRYANAKNGWIGHLWHSRYRSSLVYPSASMRVIRYIARNPVEAGLVSRPWDWPHASTADLIGTSPDPYITSRIINGLRDDWSVELDRPIPATRLEELRARLHAGVTVGQPRAA